MSQRGPQVRIIPYRFIKSRAAEAAGFSIDENTAMKQDWNFQARCRFVNAMCAIVIGVPSGRYHFKTGKAQVVRITQIFRCMVERWVDYRKSDQPVGVISNQSRQVLIRRS